LYFILIRFVRVEEFFSDHKGNKSFPLAQNYLLTSHAKNIKPARVEGVGLMMLYCPD